MFSFAGIYFYLERCLFMTKNGYVAITIGALAMGVATKLWTMKKELKKSRDEKSRLQQILWDSSANVPEPYKIYLFKPKQVDDAIEIQAAIKQGNTCLIDLANVENSKAQRIADFLGGVVHAVRGTTKRLSETVFMIIPKNVEFCKVIPEPDAVTDDSTVQTSSEPCKNAIDIGVLTDGDSGTGWKYEDYVLMVYAGADVVITGTAPDCRRIMVSALPGADEVPKLTRAHITLYNVNITKLENDQCPLQIDDDCTLNLAISGINIFKAGDFCAGIGVPISSSLTIWGSGTLHATGGEGGAGIGGNISCSCGSVTINSGTIVANGGFRAAGIGGGNGGSGGNIRINDGKVTATGLWDSAGIGNGRGSEFGHVAISGGEVNAIAGDHGADGIGNSNDSAGCIVIISSGVVSMSASE